MSSADIYLFLAIFVICMLSNFTSDLISEKLKTNAIITIVCTSLLATILIHFVGKIPKNDEGFNFEVTPEKTCDGGAYMHQSNKLCKKLWRTPKGRSKLAKYNCINGDCHGQGLYNGRPLNMGYRQDLSDDNWQNNLCKKMQMDSPQVL